MNAMIGFILGMFIGFIFSLFLISFIQSAKKNSILDELFDEMFLEDRLRKMKDIKQEELEKQKDDIFFEIADNLNNQNQSQDVVVHTSIEKIEFEEEKI